MGTESFLGIRWFEDRNQSGIRWFFCVEEKSVLFKIPKELDGITK